MKTYILTTYGNTIYIKIINNVRHQHNRKNFLYISVIKFNLIQIYQYFLKIIIRMTLIHGFLIHGLRMRNDKDAFTLSRFEAIRECKSLLERLDEGVYSMDWYGPLPSLETYEGHDTGIMEIVVQNRFKIHRMFKAKNQGATKKIKIWNIDIKCIESWNTKEITQLNLRLEDILNGTYYC